MKRKNVVISVTAKGDSLGLKIKDVLSQKTQEKTVFLDSIYVKTNGFKEVVSRAFEECDSLVFISSTGIAVRGINGLMRGKTKDPAVLVVDCTGKYVISLLSGHLGGANELTEIIAEEIDALPVITTATDNLGVDAPDMIAKRNNLVIEDMKVCKEIAALLVNNKKVAFLDFHGKIELPKGMHTYIQGEDYDGVVIVGESSKEDKLVHSHRVVLRLHRKDIILGIGCRKDFPEDDMRDRVIEKLDEYGINKERIQGIFSIDIKKDEECIISLAEYLSCEFKTFTPEEIREVHLKYDGSDFVEKITGVRCVSEPVIELAGGELIHSKEKLQGMTLAVGIIR